MARIVDLRTCCVANWGPWSTYFLDNLGMLNAARINIKDCCRLKTHDLPRWNYMMKDFSNAKLGKTWADGAWYNFSLWRHTTTVQYFCSRKVCRHGRNHGYVPESSTSIIVVAPRNVEHAKFWVCRPKLSSRNRFTLFRWLHRWKPRKETAGSQAE